MMSQRKKIIIVVLILLALVTIVVVTAVLGGDKKAKKDPHEAVCENLIAAIANKDYAAGYNLLSNSAKKSASSEQWEEKTSILGNVYRSGQTTLTNREDVAPGATGPSGAQKVAEVRLSYTVVNPVATSDVTCIAIQENKAYVVNEFSSLMRRGDTP